MKGVLSWLKSSWVIVVLGVVAVVPLTVAWFVAGGMNAALIEGRQKAASDALSKVKSKNVTYALPPAAPGEEGFSESVPPNAVKTAFFRDELARRTAQIASVKDAAVRFNRRDREPLVMGLFPAPASDSQLKRNEFARRAVLPGSPESAYGELFRRLRIRPPVDAQQLADVITAQRSGRVSQITGDRGEAALTPEQRETLDAQMLATRVANYRTHAQGTSFYGDASMLPPSVPASAPPAPPEVDLCFAWQFDYWLIEDVLGALASANTRLGGEGLGGNAETGVVKRVETISIDPGPYAGASGPGRERESDDESGGPPGAMTLSGRAQGASPLFDLREARVTLIAASATLPTLLDALASSNFITVTDLDLTEVDPWEHLRQGYYYGPDAVVRVDLTLEVVYLREWTSLFMPEGVKAALGIASGEDGGEG